MIQIKPGLTQWRALLALIPGSANPILVEESDGRRLIKFDKPSTREVLAALEAEGYEENGLYMGAMQVWHRKRGHHHVNVCSPGEIHLLAIDTLNPKDFDFRSHFEPRLKVRAATPMDHSAGRHAWSSLPMLEFAEALGNGGCIDPVDGRQGYYVAILSAENHMGGTWIRIEHRPHL